MLNKRKNEREAIHVPVDGKSGDVFDHIRTIDFSRGGFGFISDHEVPLSKEIAIEIDLEKDGTPVFVIGKVRWVEPLADSEKFRVGLSFEDVFKGSKTRLSHFFQSK